VLANALALLPSVSAQVQRAWLGSPRDLCGALDSSPFASVGGAELLVPCTALCQAIHKYKNILEKKVGMWGVQYSLHTKEKAPAYGDLPERCIRYTLTITQPPFDTTNTTLDTLLQARNKHLAAIIHHKFDKKTHLEDVLFGGCTSLVELLSPSRTCLEGFPGIQDGEVQRLAEASSGGLHIAKLW